MSTLRELEAAATRPVIEGYEVDAEGRVWSVGSNWRGYGRRQITPVTGPDGYLDVRLYVGERRFVIAVHRLVCSAFHGAQPPDYQVRHLNGDKLDNRAANLAWGTALDNAADRDAHGRTARGERNGMVRTMVQRTHCPKGHAYAEHGIINGGTRACHRCRIEGQRARRLAAVG